MSINNFKPFATGVGANVVTQAAFEADATVLSQGFVTGTANALKLNKVWRQASFIAAAIAQFVSNAGYDVLDDGNLNTFLGNFLSARNAFLNKSVAGNTDITLDPVLEANYPTLNLTGILTGNINVFIPAGRQAYYNIINATTGAFTVTFKVTGGASGVIIPQSFSTVIASDGTFVYQISTNATQSNVQLQPVSSSVAANALTLSLSPTSLSFRNAALNSGTISTINVSTTLSLTVPNGATLGTVSAQPSRLVILALNNAGAVELAVVNLSGGLQLDETNLISTTAISAAATANNVVYSNTARSNVPYRVVGFVDITEATAGAWAGASSTVQGIGGEALTALSSLGYGQTLQTVTRTPGVTYYNTTGKPIYGTGVSSAGTFNTAWTTISINGGAPIFIGLGATPSGNTQYSYYYIVPPGASYVLTPNPGTFSNQAELR